MLSGFMLTTIFHIIRMKCLDSSSLSCDVSEDTVTETNFFDDMPGIMYFCIGWLALELIGQQDGQLRQTLGNWSIVG